MPTTVDSMYVWALVEEASVLVQLVMLTLVLASLLSWFVIIQRSTVFKQSRRALDNIEQQCQQADLLTFHAESAEAQTGASTVVQAGRHEFNRYQQQPNGNPQVVLDGVERAMQLAISREERRLGRNLPFLATVGSVSPYIGLFGTVWGIMNSFIGLSQVQQATLAAVAPGIAEALIATAIGLFAAIPAVIAYNRFAARGEEMIARYYSLAGELSANVHRQLHLGRG
ncbi:protein TolQ [Halopseudomonas salegens]|uniref:Tol-Pal system protein TolQ n=1 Tax=Halopseudomonas salegens TaxID=1434072 RepID=A0A1H2HRN5_9GAMM|nr:protein TolQ [Halopseudomonas salegens]SDU34562.1 Cell division and transport-associated protein TolQ [Halopseudomonas salegens]